jgi:hypothetical protein
LDFWFENMYTIWQHSDARRPLILLAAELDQSRLPAQDSWWQQHEADVKGFFGNDLVCGCEVRRGLGLAWTCSTSEFVSSASVPDNMTLSRPLLVSFLCVSCLLQSGWSGKNPEKTLGGP